jgi:hypothetical protein
LPADRPPRTSAIASSVRHVEDCAQRLEVARRQLQLHLGDRLLIRGEGRTWLSRMPLGELRCTASTRGGQRCANLADRGEGTIDELTGGYEPADLHAFLAQRCTVHADGQAPAAAPVEIIEVPTR